MLWAEVGPTAYSTRRAGNLALGSQISKVLPLLFGLQDTQARVDEGRAEVQEELGWGRCGLWSPRQATGYLDA